MCRRPYRAFYERTTWFNCYNKKVPCLLNLRKNWALLVRAAKIQHIRCFNNTACSLAFPRQLPTYDFDADVIISGGYLGDIFNEPKVPSVLPGMHLEGMDLSTPILTCVYFLLSGWRSSLVLDTRIRWASPNLTIYQTPRWCWRLEQTWTRRIACDWRGRFFSNHHTVSASPQAHACQGLSNPDGQNLLESFSAHF